MTETNNAHPETQVPAADLPPDVTSGEKIMAGLAIAFAVLIALIGVDMLTGGRVTGMIRGGEAPGGG